MGHSAGADIVSNVVVNPEPIIEFLTTCFDC